MQTCGRYLLLVKLVYKCQLLLLLFLKYLQQGKPLLWYDILYIKSKKEIFCTNPVAACWTHIVRILLLCH
jgi:hypothetical protein